MSEDISLITMDRINELQTVIDSLRSEINDVKTYMNGVLSTEIANINASIAANDATCLHKANTETATGAKTFSGGLTCSNNFNLSGQYFGTNISSQTLNANNLWVKLNGATKIYYTTSDGATANITNLPNTRSLKLISESVRYISDEDYLIYQTAIQGNIRYERTCTNGTWTSWTNENDRINSIATGFPNYSSRASKSAGTTYTAEKNGYLWIKIYRASTGGGSLTVTINGVGFVLDSNDYSIDTAWFPVKKGWSYSYTSSGLSSTTFYWIPCL